MLWNELYSKENEPSEDQVSEFINSTLFSELDNHLRQAYKVKPKQTYSNCNLNEGIWKGWNIKYQKSGKSLCTLYPKQGYLHLLVTIGKPAMNEAEMLMPLCSEYTQELFKRSGNSESKSLGFEVRDEDVLRDVKNLIEIRATAK